MGFHRGFHSTRTSPMTTGRQRVWATRSLFSVSWCSPHDRPLWLAVYLRGVHHRVRRWRDSGGGGDVELGRHGGVDGQHSYVSPTSLTRSTLFCGTGLREPGGAGLTYTSLRVALWNNNAARLASVPSKTTRRRTSSVVQLRFHVLSVLGGVVWFDTSWLGGTRWCVASGLTFLYQQ